MPVYNCESYLREAIESIRGQTYTEWEMLVVDDGSTDGSIAIVLEYAQLDARIRLLTNSGIKGPAAARNMGIEHAVGRYIAMMDADDISLPGRLDTQVRYLDKHSGIDMCGCWARTFGTANETLRPFTTDALLKATAFVRQPFVCATIMFRREAIPYRYPTWFERSEDTYFCMQLLLAHRVYNIPSVLYKYRCHPQSLTARIPLARKHAIFPDLFELWHGFTPTQEQLNAHLSWTANLKLASIQQQIRWLSFFIAHARYDTGHRILLVLCCLVQAHLKCLQVFWHGSSKWLHPRSALRRKTKKKT
jgi:glycosyltransferase involved in cell wall biosynthesis